MQGSCIFLSSLVLHVHPMVALQMGGSSQGQCPGTVWASLSFSGIHTFKPHSSLFLSHRSLIASDLFTLIWGTKDRCLVSHIP